MKSSLRAARRVPALGLMTWSLVVAIGCSRTAPTLDEEQDAQSAPMDCPIKHRNDGKFTGWPETTACQEWDVTPLEGTYGKLYVKYEEDGTLRVLNDWHLCTQKPPANFYNLFQITTGGGTQQWMTRVMATQVHVWLNGKKLGAFSRGAMGFGASPSKDQPHTIYEFSLPDVQPGALTMKLGDPGGPPFTSPEENIVMDPKGYGGVLQSGGGASLQAQSGPMLVAMQPTVIEQPRQVELHGYDLGAKPGGVTIAGAPVTVVQWTAQKVTVDVPQLLNGPQPVVLVDSSQNSSNTLVLTYQCLPSCADKQCGDDGCGATCGSCTAKEQCVGGTCVCQPDCSGKDCGDDGCGGSCGACGVGQQCEFGQCACAPACSGKSCGSDGCGGTCGGCIAGPLAKCVAGKCVCELDCAEKQCGGDGCGGSCGACDANEVCVNGACQPK